MGGKPPPTLRRTWTTLAQESGQDRRLQDQTVQWEEPAPVGGAVSVSAWWRQRGNELHQPALKCRGREYLRIVYGPEYTVQENMQRLRQRSVGAKRSLALREFALSGSLGAFCETRAALARVGLLALVAANFSKSSPGTSGFVAFRHNFELSLAQRVVTERQSRSTYCGCSASLRSASRRSVSVRLFQACQSAFGRSGQPPPSRVTRRMNENWKPTSK